MMKIIYKVSFTTKVALFLLLFVMFLLPQDVIAVDDSTQSIIKDELLEEAIRNELNKTEGELTREDLEQLQTLDASGMGIKDLSGLEYAKNIELLSLAGNEITDISPLQNLTKLRILYVYKNKIKDISALANITSLEDLELASNQISNLRPIKNLRNLTYLNANFNQISDISPLADLRGLETLKISYNQINNISPLTSLKNLTFLGLSSNQISDISPITKLPKVEDIYLSDNQINDISSFKNFDQNLGWIFLDRNQISDITSLAELAKKGQLTRWVNILFNELDIDNKDTKAWADIQTLLNYDVFLTYDPQLPKTTSTTSAIYGDIDYDGWIDGTFYSSFDLDSATVTILNDKDEETMAVNTSKGGAFKIEDLKPGDYTVVSSHKGFSYQSEKITLKAGQAAYIEHKLYVIEVKGYVKGFNGEPVKDFKMEFVGKDNVYKVSSTKDNGYFKVGEMNPDIYEITVTADGYETYTTKMKIDRSTNINIELTPLEGTKSKICNKLFENTDLLDSNLLVPLEMLKIFNLDGRLDGLTNIDVIDGNLYIPLDVFLCEMFDITSFRK